MLIMRCFDENRKFIKPTNRGASMKFFNSLILISASTLVGCSHGMMRGSVAMKTGENEAHVCLGDKEVKVGDRLSAYVNHCTGKVGGPVTGGAQSCEKKLIGEGTVTELLNQHYSVVKFDEGVKFAEGTLVEKK
jgi:hypothetical protein